VDESLKGADSVLTSEGNASEPFAFIEETRHKIALLIEGPIDGRFTAAGWIALDVGRCTKIICNAIKQMICVIGGIHDDTGGI
jgi:hypothetical protein